MQLQKVLCYIDCLIHSFNKIPLSKTPRTGICYWIIIGIITFYNFWFINNDIKHWKYDPISLFINEVYLIVINVESSFTLIRQFSKYLSVFCCFIHIVKHFRSLESKLSFVKSLNIFSNNLLKFSHLWKTDTLHIISYIGYKSSIWFSE